ncbi:DET1- and DDB1-associated protein 1 [Drosophila obscura]|uniref:DET1- and DDB1-associated protein 1 n=1 Tax=Drosophila obscura TaxID=7282 RepID=UPI000BA171E1|nr:DET1- and DDB1-associated protein 1 [Drosophila obscura]XP_022220094.1 DET1- and DDB1-associated protein 1 [Drosophila obscura]
MSVTDFIKGLPIHDSNNFTHLSNEHGIRTSQKRASVYLPTEDEASEQLIVMDKRCVLLRYLTQSWDKKITLQRKREHGNEGSVNSSTPNGNGSNSKKRPRIDPNELN